MREDKALAYFDLGKMGCYALTPLISNKYPNPKHFLVKMSPKTAKEHKLDLIRVEVDCTKTRTGARFCILKSKEPKIEMEIMEMIRPIYEMEVMLFQRRTPTLEEARRFGKNDFLVLSIKPEYFYNKKEHLT